MNNNKRVYLIIGSICTIILALGVTTAWFTWNSTTNTDVTFKVEGLDITYTGDENVLNKKLYPTMYMDNKDNIIHNFSLATTSNIYANTKISLDIINLPNELIEESFRYSLYKENNLISEGSFMDTLIFNQDNCIRFYTKAGMSDEEASTECTNEESKIESYDRELRNVYLNFKEVNVLNESECSTYFLNNFDVTSEDATKVCNGEPAVDVNLEMLINYNEIPSDYLVENNIISMTPSPILEISNTIALASNEKIISNTINNYTLYIWIDGEHYDNPLSMGGKEFYFKLKLEAENYTTPKECFATMVNEDNTTCAIIDYLCYEGNEYGKPTITDVVIPNEINGVSVVAISARNNSEIDTKSLGNTNDKKYIAKPVATIDSSGAFENKGLTSVVLPDSVILIGTSAFQNNSLTSVVIPDSVTELSSAAFKNNSLTNVTIGNKVTSIGTSTFENNNLTSVTIPDSVIAIYESAFYGNALTSVTIPDSVTIIRWSAFQNNNLTSVTIGDGITAIENSAFKNYNLTSVTIGNGVTTIGTSAFVDNNLTNVTIPNSVTSIGTTAFANNNLTSVTIGNGVTTIGTSAFANNNLTNITIPNSVTSIGATAFAANNLTTVYISKNSKLSRLEQEAFWSHTFTNPNLTTIYNLGGKSLDWNYAINGSSSTAFVSGTVTTSDGRTVTITTSE